MDYQNFIKNEVPNYVAALTQETPPIWGSMSAQHMIEHLILAIKASYGKIPVQPMTDEEQMAKRKARFFSTDVPMPRGIRVNFAPETPGPLYFKTLEEAKSKLQNDLALFFKYYAENPAARHLHPGFGLLDYSEWVEMHGRHLLHHLRQFGLIPIEDHS